MTFFGFPSNNNCCFVDKVESADFLKMKGTLPLKHEIYMVFLRANSYVCKGDIQKLDKYEEKSPVIKHNLTQMLVEKHVF